MKILITGGEGFIGRRVAATALERGHSVRVLGRPHGADEPAHSPVPGTERRAHDLTVRAGLTEVVAGVDVVVHCAAAMGGDQDHQEAVTVDGTTHLLSAMGEAGVTQVVHVSTLAIYDFAAVPRGQVLDEESPLEEDFDARSPYAWAKRKQEDLVRTVANSLGWRWTILRPGIVFGPGRTWFPHLGLQLRPNRWISYGGAGLLPLTYVGNLADAAVCALDAEGADGATVNVVDDGLPTRRLYLEVLATLTDRHPTIIDVPWELLEPSSQLATWVHRRILLGRAPLPDLFRVERLQARCKPLAYSNERAKAALGWTPRYGFEAAMRMCFPTPGREESP